VRLDSEVPLFMLLRIMQKPRTALPVSMAIFLLAGAAILQVQAAEYVAEKGVYPPPVAAASDEGERALKGFTVPEGLKVELVAAEPHLANPVAFTIDEQGRFFVVETFRLHAGVTDIRGHMDWLDDELAVKTVEERVRYMSRREGNRISQYTSHSDRLRLLVDDDGDGKVDRATVFADGFNAIEDGLAAGVLARRGDVYFANIPNLWLLRDTKGTGVADFKRSLSQGYGIRVGFIGHDLHGLRFGPDGKLYYSIGDRGGHIRRKEGGVVENHETGVVYRCDPDGSNLEIFATGLRNPQELVFDQYGNLWTGDNNSDGGDPARWVYLVEGGDCGWRIGWQFINSPNARGPWLAEKMCYPQFEGQAAYIIPPLANIGNGPSGLAYYPGTGLNERYRDNFFLCDFRGGSGSGVHAITVRSNGAGYAVSSRSDFLWNVLVTDGDFGYDGCYYVTDWVNGWNQTGKGRLYRVFDPATRQAPEVLETKKLFAEGFSQRTPEQLVVLLRHRDQRVRQEAQFALVEKNGFAALREVSRDETADALARLHAIWGLGQLGRKIREPVGLLLGLTSSTNVEVRAQAVKVLSDLRAAEAYDVFVKLLNDPSPRTRFFAAIGLGRLGRQEAFPFVVSMVRANDDRDVYLRHAGVMALAGCGDVAGVHRLKDDSSKAVRLAAVVALRRLAHPGVQDFLKDQDAAVVLEAARAINDLPITAALPALAALSSDASLLKRQEEAAQVQRERVAKQKNPKNPDVASEPDVLFHPLLRRIVNAHFRLGQPENAEALVAFAASASGPSAVRAEALNVLEKWAEPSGRDNVTGLWRPLKPRMVSVARSALRSRLDALLQNPSTTLKLSAIRVAAQLKIREGADAAFGVVANKTQPPDVRAEALKALAAFKSSRLDEALKLAGDDDNEGLRNEAIRIQARLRPSAAIAKLKALLEQGSTTEKQAALAVLASVPGEAADAVLSPWLDRLLAKDVPAELQLDVLEAAATRPTVNIKERLQKFERTRPASDDLRSFRECLEGGQVAEGRRIFVERQDVFCIRCHKIHGEGGDAGPDLTKIGAQKSREYILESITFPNKQIAAGFESVVLTMKDRNIHAGTLKRETSTTLDIVSPEDGPMQVKKADVEKRERGQSGMPEELRQVLSKRDLRNLVEYLSSLK
jgi:quinoprotein glucose dehydrogenase